MPASKVLTSENPSVDPAACVETTRVDHGWVMRTAVRWAGVAAATSALGYALPSVTAISAVRRCVPRLAGRGRPGHVALTFDDGPDARGTPEIADILGELDVAATFFVLGEQVAAHPDEARRLVAEGHEIALHGWNHRNSLFVSPHGLRASLVRALDEIERDHGGAAGVVPAAVWDRDGCDVLGEQKSGFDPGAVGCVGTGLARRGDAGGRGAAMCCVMCAAAAPCCCTTATARLRRIRGG